MITCSSNVNKMRVPHIFFGLSSDVKPVDKYEDVAVANGSIFIEIDTGDYYMYDEENKQWYGQ